MGLKKERGIVIDSVNNVTLDWLSFTYKVPFDIIPEQLQREDYGFSAIHWFWNDFPEFDVILENGISLNYKTGYYEHVLQWNDNIRISFDAEGTSKGVNVMVPSHGIHWIYDLFFPEDDFYDAVKLFRLLIERHCWFTRIDIAADDFSKTYTPRYYAEKMQNGEISCNFRYWSFMSSCSKSEADTIYFGKRKGNKFVRIYNKAAESEGEIDSIRYEVELHKDMANAMVDFIINSESTGFDFGNYWISNIFRVIDLRYLDSSHRSHNETNKDWEDFVKLCFNSGEEIKKVKISVPTKPISFEKLDNWIRNSVMPSLVTYADCVGLDYLLRMLHTTLGSKNHRLIIDDYEIYLRDLCKNG